MKLKYYMRGMGIGIILTTLILSIANPKEKLTDSEVKERAKAMGMMDKGEKEVEALCDILEQAKPSVKPTIAPTQTPMPTVPPDSTETPESSSTPVPSETAENTIIPLPTETPAPTPTIAVKLPKNDSRDGKNSGELITFTIKGGMTSSVVADVLEDKGLIGDASDFNKYIVGEGKASIIMVGTYTLPMGASYEEIVAIITEN